MDPIITQAPRRRGGRSHGGRAGRSRDGRAEQWPGGRAGQSPGGPTERGGAWRRRGGGLTAGAAAAGQCDIAAEAASETSRSSVKRRRPNGAMRGSTSPVAISLATVTPTIGAALKP